MVKYSRFILGGSTEPTKPSRDPPQAGADPGFSERGFGQTSAYII